MEEDIKLLRTLAVQRFRGGEIAESICTSLGKSRFWLYKWVKRFDESDQSLTITLVVLWLDPIAQRLR